MAIGLLESAITAHLNAEMPQLLTDAVGRNDEIAAFFPSTLVKKPSIQWRVISAGNSSFTSYGEGSPEPAAGAETRLKAELAWKRIGGTVGIDIQILETTPGFELLGDTLKTEMAGALKSYLDQLSTQLVSDGTGNGGLDVTGILAAVSNSITYAGLSRVTYAFWQSVVQAAQGGVLTLAQMKSVSRQIRDGIRDGRVTHWVCNPTIFNLIGDLLEADTQKRIDISQTGARAIGQGLSFEGGYRRLWFEGAEVIEVRGWPAQTLHALDMREISLEVVRDIKANPPKQVADQMSWFMPWSGQLRCNHPGRQGVITGILG